MQVEGVVEHIIFKNEENSYAVLVLKTSEGMTTVSGIFPSVSAGEKVVAYGEYKTTKYGEQFQVTECEIISPNDLSDIIKYLSSGLIAGVGEKTAERIVNVFKEDTLNVIENNPEKIAEIKGISRDKAINISKSLVSIKAMQKAMMFLQKNGISTNLALKIYQTYSDKTQQLICENPYRLIEDVDGIGFLTADRIALKLSISKDSDFRMRAGIVYLLKDMATSQGSTYMPYVMLLDKITELIGGTATRAKVDDLLARLATENIIKLYELNGELCVVLEKYFTIEKSISHKLKLLQKNFETLNLNINDDILDFENKTNIKLHEKQKLAVEMAVNGGIVVITGGPGTGKTTIINCILSILNKHGMRVELVAPTGRASKRMSETTGRDCKTIHRLLDLDYKDGKGFFTYNERKKLDCDVVIIDEMSMVDAYLMNCLIKAVRSGARVVMVGDKDQLASVGAGNVLGDIIESDVIPVSFLTEIYRQGKESLIITNAHKINNGVMPTLYNVDSDFFFERKNTHEEILQTVIDMVTKRIPDFKKIQKEKIQVLTPMKKGVCGANNLNDCLQKLINPKADNKTEFSIGEDVFRVGDKVMQTVNNYSLEWQKDYEQGVGVFNGDMGIIKKIDLTNGEIQIEFDDGRISCYKQSDCRDLTKAYAISIHKSQGSEFDIVVLPIIYGFKGLCTRNLLYTAVTRAKKMVVLVGSVHAVKSMVDNNYTEKRYSLLKDFLIN